MGNPGLSTSKRPRITGRGIVMLMRPVPLTVWSVPTVGFGFLLQSRREPHDGLALLVALLGAVVLQGVITHGLNDLYDWQSGTDQESLGIISGGSKVLVTGALNIAGIWRLIVLGLVCYALLAWGLAEYRGFSVLIWAACALIGSVLYSLPPWRLSYRPLLGEWGALFPAMACGVAMGALAANRHLGLWVLVGVAWYAVFCVASVMQHHFSDIDADWKASPPKRTTPAFWRRGLGRTPQEPVAAYEVLALGIAVVGATHDARVFVPMGLASATALALTLVTRPTGSIRHLTRMDLAIKAIVPITVLAELILRLAA